MKNNETPQNFENENLPIRNDNNSNENKDAITLRQLDVASDISRTAESLGRTAEDLGIAMTHSYNRTLDTVDNLLEAQKHKRETEQIAINSAKMFERVDKVIEKKFKDQDRAMDKAEKTLDMALERWDKDVIISSLNTLANVANTNPLTNGLNNPNQINQKEISPEDWDDDNFKIDLF